MTDSNSKKSVLQLQKIVIDALEDVKAHDISVFNTEKLSPLFERVIIASGTSNRQTKALASSVRDEVREAGYGKPRVEGEENGEWIIVDCGPVVAHIMQPAIRQYYHLEEIWGEKPVRFKHGEDKMSELVKEKLPKPKAAPAETKSTKTTKKTKPSSKTKVRGGDEKFVDKGELKATATHGSKKPAKKVVKKVSTKASHDTHVEGESSGAQSNAKTKSKPPSKEKVGRSSTKIDKPTKTDKPAKAKSTSSSRVASTGAPVPARKPRNSPPRA